VSEFFCPADDFITCKCRESSPSEREARLVFKAGKNRDGYFAADDLIKQVDKAIDIFESRTKGFTTGLFIFDNAKRSDNALSARKMPKNPLNGWTHRKGGANMRNGSFNARDSETQAFYYPDDHPTMPGWFKGMEIIIKERGLWPAEGLNAQCQGFKCEPGRTDCCCRRLLFTQPDFTSQKSQLEEFITSRGHICDFYPKYHCEMNFIEQYWGASKYRYRSMARTTNIAEMEKNVLASLDDVPLQQIRRCVSLFSLYPHYSHHSFILATQTDQRDSSQPTHKAFREHRLFGLTKNTTDTVLYLLTSSLLSRSLLKCNS